jgi:hypothetical protein
VWSALQALQGSNGPLSSGGGTAVNDCLEHFKDGCERETTFKSNAVLFVMELTRLEPTVSSAAFVEAAVETHLSLLADGLERGHMRGRKKFLKSAYDRVVERELKEKKYESLSSEVDGFCCEVVGGEESQEESDDGGTDVKNEWTAVESL